MSSFSHKLYLGRAHDKVMNTLSAANGGFTGQACLHKTVSGLIITAVEVRHILPCPGQICWKTVAGGPCLASTTIQAPTSGHMAAIGQASFNYASAPGDGAASSAVALYQGSALCKAAPSQGSTTVQPLHMQGSPYECVKVCIGILAS